MLLSHPLSENNLPPVEVNLIGEKVLHPVVHFCELCNFPIRLYGRLIPCKHVYCYTCAKKCDNFNDNAKCPKCNGEVQRIEELSPESVVWMCDAGGPTCKRTYLSQRDLLSHIKMRHKDSINNSLATNSLSTNSIPTNSMATMSTMAATRVQQTSMTTTFPPQIPIPPPNMQVPPPSLGIPPNVNISVPPPNFLPPLSGIPPISSGVNSNLISVPIQQQPPIIPRLPGNPPILPGNPRFMLPPPNMLPPHTRPHNPQMRF